LTTTIQNSVTPFPLYNHASIDYTDCSLVVECHGDRDVASAKLGVDQRPDARLHDART
jgi:hypothetical protein